MRRNLFHRFFVNGTEITCQNLQRRLRMVGADRRAKPPRAGQELVEDRRGAVARHRIGPGRPTGQKKAPAWGARRRPSQLCPAREKSAQPAIRSSKIPHGRGGSHSCKHFVRLFECCLVPPFEMFANCLQRILDHGCATIGDIRGQVPLAMRMIPGFVASNSRRFSSMSPTRQSKFSRYMGMSVRQAGKSAIVVSIRSRDQRAAHAAPDISCDNRRA